MQQRGPLVLLAVLHSRFSNTGPRWRVGEPGEHRLQCGVAVWQCTPQSSTDRVFVKFSGAMAAGVLDGERSVVRTQPAARLPRDEPSSQQQPRARGSSPSRLVAVGRRQQRSRSSCHNSTRRYCGKCSRTTAITTATTAVTTRYHFCSAGGAASSKYSSSGLLLLLSVVALLSLSPSFCLASDLSVPAATATAAAAAATAAAGGAGDPKPDNLWDTISGDPDYSKLTACLEMADPSVAELLRAIPGAAAAQPLTLFAPRDSAFEKPAWRGGNDNGANDTIFDDR